MKDLSYRQEYLSVKMKCAVIYNSNCLKIKGGILYFPWTQVTHTKIFSLVEVSNKDVSAHGIELVNLKNPWEVVVEGNSI